MWDANFESPYEADRAYRFDVRTVAHARELAGMLYPDAPPLTAWVTIQCEYGECRRLLLIRENAAASIEQGRALVADPRELRGGWYQGLYRGQLRDICQWHYEVDPKTGRPQKVGTAAAKKRAAETAPPGGDQLDLFGAL